ncbi:MAG: tRNA (N(6)-L-threonylcarbamoyladenosine(37)-C(2))-methylthiotransferase MtaB [Lachnospiraceae bacterium]|nr:tRNA (N(6)-L-threonylcarbamoyladenosine(37)-C(2))-methylthiotransferase MtaB [Lachnospiraceae bacterium]
MKRKVSFHNLGCKVNAYETDVMMSLFEEAGFEIVTFDEPADVVVINTCTVTNIADRKSRQMLHRARKLNPGAIVVAAGCYVTADAERALKDEGIDICIGNKDKPQIVEKIFRFARDAGDADAYGISQGFDDEAGDAESIYNGDFKLTRLTERTRAYIKIQDGCNQFCSYCIIPFARGRTVSRSKDEILEEIKGLAAQGVKEFVITGIHISSYGYDIKYPDDKPAADRFAPEILIDLLQSIDELDGVERIRLGSLEPRIITKEFAKGLKSIRGLCPHFHLSLQSGSDSVLKRMNRHYDTQVFTDCVRILRESFDDPAVTTDVIVGFPGESEEEFKESLEFVKKTGFYQMHIFKYSRRKGTIAASMPAQLTEAQKAERSDRMEEAERVMTEDYIKRRSGSAAEVLFEEEEEICGKKYMCGYSREYVRVAVPDGASPGDINSVMLGEELKSGILLGVAL